MVDLSVNEIEFKNGQPHGRNDLAYFDSKVAWGSISERAATGQARAFRASASNHEPLALPALPPVLLHPLRRRRFPLTSQRVTRSSGTFTADEATLAAL
jgi:hypothetical protein